MNGLACVTGMLLAFSTAGLTGGASLGAMTVTPAGRLVVAGTFRGSYDFGDGPVQSGAGGALFVAGLAL
jgi:hypothetical protein